jgi:hypothetical protein
MHSRIQDLEKSIGDAVHVHKDEGSTADSEDSTSQARP